MKDKYSFAVFRPRNVDDLYKTYPEDEVFDTQIDGDEDSEDPELTLLAGKDPEIDSEPPATTLNSIPLELIQMEKCIVFTNKIQELLQTIHGVSCSISGCPKQWIYTKVYVGSCLVISWKCSSGHFGGSWSSQPMFNRARAGNLLLSSCLLLTGNSFAKIALFFKFLNLRFISKSLFYQHQGLYIAPTVQSYWETMKKSLWEERSGKEVLLSGDARNDSPGHCAQYCTYTLADMDDKVILQQNVLDVREVEGRKSTNMERLGFERGMDVLMSTNIDIKEVITDAHTGIGGLMSKFLIFHLYNYIIHDAKRCQQM